MSKAVYIEWLDHGNYENSIWRDRAELENLCGFRVQTIGWVVTENKHRIVIAGTENGTPATKWTGEICILKNCIVKRRNIRVPR